MAARKQSDEQRLLAIRAAAATADAKAMAARAKADLAQSRVQLERAKIESSGKQIIWNPRTGMEEIVKSK